LRTQCVVLLGASTLTAMTALALGPENTTEVEGYIPDSACASARNFKKPMDGEKCALECAKAASPLVILTHDGTIYWPISPAAPATGQNARLIEYAGKRVVVPREDLRTRTPRDRDPEVRG